MKELNSINSLKVSLNEKQGKDKQLLVNYIRKTIEKKTGLTYGQLLKYRTQSERYRIGLRYFTTTNKAICEALNIPVEAGTRRKRKLEKAGLLVSTPKKEICPYTGAKAHYYTTNKALFNAIINYKTDK